HATRFVLLVADHEDHDFVGAGLRLAPAGGLAPIDGAAALELATPLLRERDHFQTTLTQATIVVTAAGRQEPPVYFTVLACDHARALVAGAWKLGAMPPLHNRPTPPGYYLLVSLKGDPSWSRLPCRRSVRGQPSTSSSARPRRR